MGYEAKKADSLPPVRPSVKTGTQSSLLTLVRRTRCPTAQQFRSCRAYPLRIPSEGPDGLDGAEAGPPVTNGEACISVLLCCTGEALTRKIGGCLVEALLGRADREEYLTGIVNRRGVWQLCGFRGALPSRWRGHDTERRAVGEIGNVRPIRADTESPVTKAPSRGDFRPWRNSFVQIAPRLT